MNKEKYYTSRYDVVFKSIFLDENNSYLLREFLSRLLKREVEEIIYLKQEQTKEYIREKTKILDFLARVDKEYIHIELNSSYKKYYDVRNFSYFATIYTRNTRTGEEYDVKTKFLHIDLSYGLRQNEDEYRVYNIIDKNGNKYIENFEIIEYNMDKLMKYYENYNQEKLKEYDYLIMLDLTKEELSYFVKGDKFMEEYERKITEVNKDPVFQSFMTAEEDYQKCLNTDRRIAREEGHEEGRREGLAEGREEGKHIQQREIAKNLKDRGISIKDISEICNLAIEEVIEI